MRCRCFGFLLAGAAAPVLAQEPPRPLTISGSATVVSDYRLRGVSQSNDRVAVQGGLAVTHLSGVYANIWASSIAGWGARGGPKVEVDLTAGYRHAFGAATVDAGLTWYTYPGARRTSAYVEPFARLSGTIGPATLVAGVAYAPKQAALGDRYRTGAAYVAGIADRPGARHDNLYLSGDASGGVPGSRASLRAHIGYSRGNPGLGPSGTSAAPTGRYWDWLLGLDYAILGPLTIGVAYVDTDLRRREFAYLLPEFAKTGSGRTIAGATGLVTLSAAF